jgi:hypothetical protein
MVQQTVGGWEPSIIGVSSGLSAGVFTNGANGAFERTLNSLTGDGYSANNRPNIVPGVGCNSGERGKQILNPAAFTFVWYLIGTVGDAPREPKAGQREPAAAPAQQSP